MKNKKTHFSCLLFFLASYISVGYAQLSVCDRYMYLGESWVNAISLCKEALARGDLNAKVMVGLKLFDNELTAGDGLKLLEEAASAGSSDAAYWIGWVHLNGVIPNADKNKALEYFQRVNGDYKAVALIGIGVVYAEGTETIQPDVDLTKKKFMEAQKLILSRVPSNANVEYPPQVTEKLKQDIKRNTKWYMDAEMLKHFANKYDIDLYDK